MMRVMIMIVVMMTNGECTRACLKKTPFFACWDGDTPMCGSEVVFTISVIILIVKEVLHFVALREVYIHYYLI